MKLFRRSPPLPPPPEGQDDFWATVHVILHQPLFEEGPEDDDSGPAVGYYRNFGLRAAPASVHSILEEAIQDGRIDWPGTEWHLVDPSTLDKPIRRQIEYVPGEPIWYMSGHIYYTADEDDEEPSLSS